MTQRDGMEREMGIEQSFGLYGRRSGGMIWENGIKTYNII